MWRRNRNLFKINKSICLVVVIALLASVSLVWSAQAAGKCVCISTFSLSNSSGTTYKTPGLLCKGTSQENSTVYDSKSAMCKNHVMYIPQSSSTGDDCSRVDYKMVKKEIGKWGGTPIGMSSKSFSTKCTLKGGTTKPSTGSSGSGSSGGSTGGSGSVASVTAAGLINTAAKKMNPGRIKSPQQLIGYAIKFNMAALGAIALGLYIWAGFLWMTSGGNSERRHKAMLTLMWVTFGIAVMFASYLAIKFVFEQVILK